MDQGLKVCLVDRAETVMERAREIGDGATGFVTDVSDRAAMLQLSEEIGARFGLLLP